jgi:hypothetical protein
MAGRLRRGLGMSEFEMVAARLAVTAWLMAVNGDGSALAAMADGDAAHWLLNPVRKEWVIAAGPLVTEIVISGVDPAAEPPELRVIWRFTGRQRIEPALGPGDAVPWDWTDGEQIFAGLLTLELTGSGASPWRLTHGHVETLDAHLGYTFVSRFETPEEYRRRAGTGPGEGVLVPTDTYLLIAGFAEHDEKFGSTALVEVRRETVPSRDEAEQLIWPAVDAETTRALGAGDWRPSLNWLDVIELLEAGGVFIPPPERTGN